MIAILNSPAKLFILLDDKTEEKVENEAEKQNHEVENHVAPAENKRNIN